MSILTRKYPFPQNNHWLRDSAVYSAIVFCILYFLQPFGFAMYKGDKLMATLGFGLITFVCTAIYSLTVLNMLARHIKPWRIWHEGLAILGLTLFIGLCNFWLFSYIFSYPQTISVFFVFFYWTLIIGVIITTLSLVLEYNRHLRNQMETLLNNTTEEQKDIVITIKDTNVRGNDLTLPLNDLLYIEAQKNNVVVCYLSEGKMNNKEVHTTLTAVLEDLKDYENVFQCHRSFVVNLNNINSAKGNSNGYQLTLKECRLSIPVSRSFVPKLKSFIA